MCRRSLAVGHKHVAEIDSQASVEAWVLVDRAASVGPGWRSNGVPGGEDDDEGRGVSFSTRQRAQTCLNAHPDPAPRAWVFFLDVCV